MLVSVSRTRGSRSIQLGEFFRSQLVEALLGAGGRQCCKRDPRQPRKYRLLGPGASFDLGISIDDHVADETQQPRRAIALARAAEQFRRLIDELGGVVGGHEARMHDQLIEEAQIGHDAANPKLPQRAMHARNGLFGCGRPCGHLHQQRIVEARDDGAGVGRSGVEPDAEPGRTAIGRDAAIVGDEIVFGVFGGDAALQCVRVDANLFLPRYAALRRADRRARGDADLRLDQIDAGDAFGNRVLDLNARIDFDEVELAGVGVLQELDGAGARDSSPRGRS